MNHRVRKLDPSALGRALQLAAEVRGAGVVVFDLDSTLLDNRPRQARILREFGELHGIVALRGAKPEHWDSWSLRRAMVNAGLPDDEAQAWLEQAKTFWRDRFFTSEYCRIDEAIFGAVRFVSDVAARGAQVAYCTGRHEEMRAGTVECFGRLGFPSPGGKHPVHLFMKPTFDMSDDAYKTTAYAQLRRLGRVLAVFDNEPTHINGYRGAFADALAVHLATDDSGRDVDLAEGVVSVSSFAVL
jgi:hypothetical protein